MKIQFTDPATDFSDGLEVIRAYHDHLLAQGHRLLQEIQAIEAHGLDADRANRLARLYADYQRTTVLHHQDEERILFPAIVGHDLLIDGMIERLTLDHGEIEESWRVLEIDLKALLYQHRLQEQLLEKAERFEKLQREHLTRENEDFLPRLLRLLNPNQRRNMGKTMAMMRNRKTVL